MKLENEFLLVEIAAQGAEVTRIFNKMVVVDRCGDGCGLSCFWCGGGWCCGGGGGAGVVPGLVLCQGARILAM